MTRHERAPHPSSIRACGFTLAALAWACGPTDEENSITVHAEVSERVHMVVNVHWESEEPSTGYVEYGTTKELGLNTPMVEAATRHTQPLVGLHEDTVYYYRVVGWDGDASQSEIQSIRTGYIPPGLPTLDLTIGGGHDQFIVAPALGSDRCILIIDPEGQIVWYYIDDATEYEHYRARVARDGKGVVYSATEMTPDPVEDSEIVRVSWDGSERTSIPVPYLAHDWVEHADGTIAALTLEDRDVDGSNIRGNKLVEVAPDGTTTDVWTSWNCFDPVEDPGSEQDIGAALGWTFTNALDYDATNQVYYVGIHNFSSIAKVSRATGECEWVFGSTASTIDFDINAGVFYRQHQFHVFGNRIVLMDNEGAITPQESRVVEYEIDEDAGVAYQRWSYTSNPPVYTWSLGETQRLPGNETFINWSTAGQMERVTESGEVVWQLNSRLGAAFGFSALVENLYEP